MDYSAISCIPLPRRLGHVLCQESFLIFSFLVPFSRSTLAHRWIDEIFYEIWKDENFLENWKCCHDLVVTKSSSMSVSIGLHSPVAVQRILYDLFNRYDLNRFLAFSSLKNSFPFPLPGFPSAHCFSKSLLPGPKAFSLLFQHAHPPTHPHSSVGLLSPTLLSRKALSS